MCERNTEEAKEVIWMKGDVGNPGGRGPHFRLFGIPLVTALTAKSSEVCFIEKRPVQRGRYRQSQYEKTETAI